MTYRTLPAVCTRDVYAGGSAFVPVVPSIRAWLRTEVQQGRAVFKNERRGVTVNLRQNRPNSVQNRPKVMDFLLI